MLGFNNTLRMKQFLRSPGAPKTVRSPNARLVAPARERAVAQAHRRANELIVALVLTATVSNGTAADAVDLPANQSMLLEDLMSSFQTKKAASNAAVTSAAVEAPAPKASPSEVTSQSSATADVQEMVQNKVQEAASAAGSMFQSSAGVGELKEADIKQQMQLIVPDSKNDVLSLILGVGGAAAVSLLVTIVQAVQRSQSDKKLKEKITGLSTERSDLQAQVKDLSDIRDSLEKALEGEKEAKGQSLQRRTELDSQLEKTMKSLDAVSAEKELTKATLTDTQKDLEKEKKAGAALGEHVITLSKQLEDQTARAVKTEDTSKHLQKDVEARVKEIKEEKDSSTKLSKEVSKLEDNLKRITEEAASQASAAHELGESAKEAKAKVDAAYAKVSTQLQSTVDQVKTLKASLAETTKALETTDGTVKKLEAELGKSRSDGKALQLRLDKALGDVKKAKEVIDQNQQDNSELRMEKHSLQDRVDKLSQTLEDTTFRLSTEVDTASEMKSQLAELKLEYIAAGDKLEAEQSVIRNLQVDLRNMESALNAVSHDKKAAQMDNVQLGSQLEAAQKAVLAAEAAQMQAEEQLSSSHVMIEGLQGRVEDVTASLEASSTAVQSTAEELEAERAERAALTAQVEALKQHVVSIEQAERTAHEQAQSAVHELRQEIQAVKARKKAPKPSSSTKSVSERVPALATTASKPAAAVGTKKAGVKKVEKKS